MHIEIPYNVRPRPDTGLYNAKLGIWLFLASEVMLFGALFSSLILLRSGVDHWERASDRPILVRVRNGNARHIRGHGRPRRMRGGATVSSRMCCVM